MALGWRGQYLRYQEFFLNIMALYRRRADLRAFLEVVLSLSTIIIFLVFALKPTALTIISLYNEIKEKQNTVAVLDKKIADLRTASNVFNQNRELLPQIDTAVMNVPQTDTVAKQIQGIATKDSASVLGISMGEITLIGTPSKKSAASTGLEPLPGGVMEMPIAVSIRGDFANLIAFLKDFENLRTIAKLDVLGINASTTDTGRVIVALISGRLPYLGN